MTRLSLVPEVGPFIKLLHADNFLQQSNMIVML